MDGDGREQGVVFCEMEGREHTEADLVDNAIRHALFPGTGYQWETGGLTKDIATLSHEEVVSFPPAPTSLVVSSARHAAGSALLAVDRCASTTASTTTLPT